MSSASLRCHVSPMRMDLAAFHMEQQVPQKPFINCDIGAHVRACCFPGQGSDLFVASHTGSWVTGGQGQQLPIFLVYTDTSSQHWASGNANTFIIYMLCIRHPTGSHVYDWKELQSSDPHSTQMGKSRLTKVT